MIRLVTFDLDNTLWPLTGVIERARVATDDWLASRVPTYCKLSRDEAAALHAAVVGDEPALEHDITALRVAMLRRMLERCGETPNRADALAQDAVAEFLRWRHRVELFPDALPALAKLKATYTLAALTNGNADYRRLGLARYFAFGYCAADVGGRKPQPAMFQRALAHAGVAAAEAVHVGDHLVDDVQGAHAVGMATVWLNRRQADESADADVTVTSLAELPAALAAMDDAS